MTKTRAEKAQRLVFEERVKILRDWAIFVEAVVQGDSGLYEVNLFSEGHYFCSCDWGADHSYTDDLCAHALAVKLAVAKEQVP